MKNLAVRENAAILREFKVALGYPLSPKVEISSSVPPRSSPWWLLSESLCVTSFTTEARL